MLVKVVCTSIEVVGVNGLLLLCCVVIESDGKIWNILGCCVHTDKNVQNVFIYYSFTHNRRYFILYCFIPIYYNIPNWYINP